MIVFPKAIVDLYSDDITSDGKTIDFSKPMTQSLMETQITELFDKFPQTEGLMVRVGETYTYDVPYHMGNSPGDAFPDDATDEEQQKLWADFITFLRDLVCEKLRKTLVFRVWRAWSSYDEGWYTNVTDLVRFCFLFFVHCSVALQY